MLSDSKILRRLRVGAKPFQKLILVMFLLTGLGHAWGGHDWLFGHHHRQLGEASYSASWGEEEKQRSDKAVVPPSLITLKSLEGDLPSSTPQRWIWISFLHRNPDLLGPDRPRPPPNQRTV